MDEPKRMAIHQTFRAQSKVKWAIRVLQHERTAGTSFGKQHMPCGSASAASGYWKANTAVGVKIGAFGFSAEAVRVAIAARGVLLPELGPSELPVAVEAQGSAFEGHATREPAKNRVPPLGASSQPHKANFLLKAAALVKDRSSSLAAVSLMLPFSIDGSLDCLLDSRRRL